MRFNHPEQNYLRGTKKINSHMFLPIDDNSQYMQPFVTVRPMIKRQLIIKSQYKQTKVGDNQQQQSKVSMGNSSLSQNLINSFMQTSQAEQEIVIQQASPYVKEIKSPLQLNANFSSPAQKVLKKAILTYPLKNSQSWTLSEQKKGIDRFQSFSKLRKINSQINELKILINKQVKQRVKQMNRMFSEGNKKSIELIMVIVRRLQQENIILKRQLELQKKKTIKNIVLEKQQKTLNKIKKNKNKNNTDEKPQLQTRQEKESVKLSNNHIYHQQQRTVQQQYSTQPTINIISNNKLTQSLLNKQQTLQTIQQIDNDDDNEEMVKYQQIMNSEVNRQRQDKNQWALIQQLDKELEHSDQEKQKHNSSTLESNIRQVISCKTKQQQFNNTLFFNIEDDIQLLSLNREQDKLLLLKQRMKQQNNGLRLLQQQHNYQTASKIVTKILKLKPIYQIQQSNTDNVSLSSCYNPTVNISNKKYQHHQNQKYNGYVYSSQSKLPINSNKQEDEQLKSFNINREQNITNQQPKQQEAFQSISQALSILKHYNRTHQLITFNQQHQQLQQKQQQYQQQQQLLLQYQQQLLPQQSKSSISSQPLSNNNQLYQSKLFQTLNKHNHSIQNNNLSNQNHNFSIKNNSLSIKKYYLSNQNDNLSNQNNSLSIRNNSLSIKNNSISNQNNKQNLPNKNPQLKPNKIKQIIARTHINQLNNKIYSPNQTNQLAITPLNQRHINQSL